MPEQEVELVCLPYAGGSEAAFAPLKKHLAAGINMLPIEYPGRGSRQGEPFYGSVAEAAADIVSRVSGLKGPFAIMGHSLGALIGYESCRLIEKRGGRMPIHLFASGKQAPHIMIKEKQAHLLSDENFKDEVMALGGTPEEIFKHPELAGYYLPILRADFRISELYRYQEAAPLKELPVTVLGGDSDEITSLQLSDWKRHTTGGVRVMMLSGGHFFIAQNYKAVADIINHTLTGKP